MLAGKIIVIISLLLSFQSNAIEKGGLMDCLLNEVVKSGAGVDNVSSNLLHLLAENPEKIAPGLSHYDKTRRMAIMNRVLNDEPKLVKSKEELEEKYLNWEMRSSPTHIEPLENVEIDNFKWIDDAELMAPSGKYFDLENAAMKRLNDTLGDKNLVTSLTNLHKDLFLEELATIARLHPGFKFSIYSDFKSVRIRIHPDSVPEGIKNDLGMGFKKVSDNFYYQISDILPEEMLKSENINLWFMAGWGDTPDQAGLASKFGRDHYRIKNEKDKSYITNSLLPYEKIKDEINNSLTSAKGLMGSAVRGILHHSDGKKLLTTLEANGEKITLPSFEVFEIMRKVGSGEFYDRARLLQSKIKKIYGLSIDSKTLESLLESYDEIDKFTPGIWVKNREFANLKSSPFGGLTADLKGMGAFNIQRAAMDMMTGSKSLDEVLVQLRNGEREVTNSFRGKKKFLEEQADKIAAKLGLKKFISKCSGDDCIFFDGDVPLPEDFINTFVRAIAESEHAGTVRLSSSVKRVGRVPSGEEKTVNSSLDNLVTHGELVEKEIRELVTGINDELINPELMSQFTIRTKMPTTEAKGAIQIYIAPKVKSAIDGKIRRRIINAIEKGIIEVNKKLEKEFPDRKDGFKYRIHSDPLKVVKVEQYFFYQLWHARACA